MLKTTVPEATCTCTSTGRASTPSNATVDTRATIVRPPSGSMGGTFAEHAPEHKRAFAEIDGRDRSSEGDATVATEPEAKRRIPCPPSF